MDSALLRGFHFATGMVVHIWTVEPTTTGTAHSGAVPAVRKERVIRANRAAGWPDYFTIP